MPLVLLTISKSPIPVFLFNLVRMRVDLFHGKHFFVCFTKCKSYLQTNNNTMCSFTHQGAGTWEPGPGLGHFVSVSRKHDYDG